MPVSPPPSQISSPSSLIFSICILPLFILRLIISSTPSLLLLFSIKLLPHRSFLISTILFFIALFILFQNSLLTPQEQLASPNSSLLKQKSQLESWLNKQPTHRDILFNLSKVNQALGNQQQALKFLTQAQNLDPNHKLFQEN